MSTNFPTSLDALTNPVATDAVATVDHAAQHANANDAIEALEAKVGIDSSAVTTSHDYKLSEVTGSDKAVSKTATQTLTNKTITALVNGGTITIPTGTDTLVARDTTDTLANKTLTTPKIGTSINDVNGNEVIRTPATASAVNDITITNAVTTADPLISATGDDTNISLKIRAKGTGKVKIGSADIQFPNSDGSAGQALTTNGSGVLSFSSVAGSPTGSITAFGGSSAPTDWLLCDGSAVSRTTYATLFGVISTSFGVGDGSSTFNLPDLRGRIPVGKDSGTFNTLGATGGSETHTLTSAQIPNINPTLNDVVTTSGGATRTGLLQATSNNAYTTIGLTLTGLSGNSHNNIQPYQVINYIIKI